MADVEFKGKDLSKMERVRAQMEAAQKRRDKKKASDPVAQGTGIQPRTMRRVQADNKRKKEGFWHKAARTMKETEKDVVAGKRSGLVGVTKALGGEYDEGVEEEEDTLAKKSR